MIAFRWHTKGFHLFPNLDVFRAWLDENGMVLDPDRDEPGFCNTWNVCKTGWNEHDHPISQMVGVAGPATLHDGGQAPPAAG